MDNESVVPRSLTFHLLEQITNGFSKDRKLGSGAYGAVYKGVHKHGERIAVKLLHHMPGQDDEQFEKEYSNLASLEHKNIVQLVGYCNETRREYVEYNSKMVLAEETRRALCFEYMSNGSLDNFLSDESSGHDWRTRFAIIKGICDGLRYLHEELESPIYHLDLKPANILLDKNMVPKIADFGLSKLFGQEQTQITKSPIGTLGYLPPEYIDGAITSIKFDIFSLGVVMIKIMTGPKGYFRSAEMSTEEFVELVHANWRKRLQKTSMCGLESHSEQVKRCVQIALSCVEPDRRKRPSIGDIVNELNETKSMIEFTDVLQSDIGSSVDQMSPGIFTWSESLNASQQRDSGRLLDVHPLQVCLPFEENKLISWPLHLANNSEDEHVAFRCTPKTSELYFNWLSQLCGILPPKSSCTYVVTMERQQQPPANMDALDLFLDCGLVPKGTELSDVNHYTILSDIEESEIDDVVITVCHPAGDTVTSEQPIRPRIKILWSVDSEFVTMDVHPTEPWVLAGHYSGYVSMWNYETQARMLLLKIAKGRRDEPCRSIRFIARMEWFVAGDVDGFIHVYACMTNKGLKKFKAHKAWVMSLSIHPSHPFLLSSSDDHLIKLWNWENDWSCIRTFKSHSNRVEQVMFNPRDGKTFASVSLDGTVKIWSTFSHVPIATFDSFPDKLLCVDYFSPDGDRQYLVTGSTNGMARIWDLETEACIRQLRGLRCDWGCNVGVIDYLPSLPILITASPDNVVSFHNTITYRSVKTFNFMLGRVNAGFAYIKSIRSLAIGFSEGIAIMEIN